MMRRLLTSIQRRLSSFQVLPDPPDWHAGMLDVDHRMREACIEVATELGETALATRMRTHEAESFPAAEYLTELDALHPGAGADAHERARHRHR